MSAEDLNDKSFGVLSLYGYTVNNEVLGVGAYSVLHSAFSKTHETEVAIKVIPKIRGAKEFLTQFLPKELELMKELVHPNIVTFMQVIETNVKIYIVMELVKGLSLLQAVQAKKQLNEKTSEKIFRQLCNGIEYIHEKGIAHRDLKCENILLDARGYVKIIDFGYAKSNLNSTDELIRSTTFCGSYAYACPEILQGRPYIPFLADVWSLGVILYIMVFGSLPFEDTNLQRLLKLVVIPLLMPTSIKISGRCQKTIRKILTPEEIRPSVSAVKELSWLRESSNDLKTSTLKETDA
ncbi:hypothetical protein HELRODRAFT_63410 [Helobdella robusta]|uniref:Protein kinase domain-containing protein n=1 Tax=Helobdella robusta TaxID=6412 RepID=T1FXF5_HELRO|nr:hypothetical protein HELRODRAFT_63410 [Helobdella robusta]ESO13025.1 hypothetical protein HELRODRAFT_63410 [Helobdella robusta]